ncbi:MAG: hypothetical protein HYY06_30330 [Deltaproteobacteria bacterium]|nr:hypothetical protein [Deltaproteobacteria bacterium]
MLRALGLALLIGACGGREARSPDAAATEGPVARPTSVIAIAAIRGLDPVFAAARRLLGPALPAGADGRAVAVALAGLEPASRDALDPDGTVFVLVIDGEAPSVVVALPLEGAAAHVAIASGAPGVGTRAGRFFVIAADRATAAAVAPWITRTLARRAWEHSVSLEVDAAAAPRVAEILTGVVGDLAAELDAEARAARAAMGRDPEIGEPEAIAGWVEETGRRWANAIGGAAIEAHLDFSGRSVSIRIDLEAIAGTDLAVELERSAPGDVELLGLMPADAPLAVGVRRGEEERRAESARTIALLARIAGPRMAPSETATLRSLAAAWDAATGPEGAFALGLDGSRATLRVASEARDPDGAAAAIDGLADAMGGGYLGLVGERLGAWIGPASRLAHARSRVFRGGASGPLGDRWELGSIPTAGQIRVVAGATDGIDWAPAASVLGRADVAALRRAGDGRLVTLGAASPSRLVPLVAPIGGERLERLARAVAARGTADPVVWSVEVEGRHSTIHVRLK